MVHIGVSPRGAQTLVTAARVRALIDGRYAASFHDIRQIAHATLRHRIVRSFEAQADGISEDDIIDHLLETLPRELEETTT